MAKFTNHIIFACAFLTNFKPALAPWSNTGTSKEKVVDEYFEKLSDSSDSECDWLEDEG